MTEKICCVTGHRDIPMEKYNKVFLELQREILLAIGDGYTHFISGFAQGVDLIFAEVVCQLKRKYPITLEAAIPYPGRMKTPDETFQRLIRQCDIVKIHSDRYTKECYMLRNRYMVDCAERVIAVHDGRQFGGTAATMRYARQRGKEVKEILLK